MENIKTALKQNFWPISAILFCPCHLPLSMGALVSLTASTTFGAYIAANYTAIESGVAIVFSFYFVIAFMIWAVRGPQVANGQVCAVDEAGQLKKAGLSTKQIVGWGTIGMFTMPALIAASLFVREDVVGEVIRTAQSMDLANSGMIWLISISTLVMIPVTIIWLAWMWITWSGTTPEANSSEHWQYEYD